MERLPEARLHLLKMKRAYLSLLLISVSLAGAAPDNKVTSEPDAVIVLHGFGRTDRSMRPLEGRLSKAGFRVYNLRYASTKKSPEDLVDDLSRRVQACCSEAPTLHFVGHSLGGILIRAYLEKQPLPNVGRVVLLAPPNHGSELVDALHKSVLFRWTLGPSAKQLGTDPESLPNRLPPPTVEVGVIAGTRSVNPIGSVVLPEEDDGMVSLKSTKLEGMTDYLVVRSSHAFIMRSQEVGTQTIHFLQRGRFRHEAAE
jgi:hypothetical protein